MTDAEERGLSLSWRDLVVWPMAQLLNCHFAVLWNRHEAPCPASHRSRVRTKNEDQCEQVSNEQQYLSCIIFAMQIHVWTEHAESAPMHSLAN